MYVDHVGCAGMIVFKCGFINALWAFVMRNAQVEIVQKLCCS